MIFQLATATENYRVIPFIRHVRMSTLDLILLKLLLVFLAGKAAALADPVSPKSLQHSE
jgi:hypothetical protein